MSLRFSAIALLLGAAILMLATVSYLPLLKKKKTFFINFTFNILIYFTAHSITLSRWDHPGRQWRLPARTKWHTVQFEP
jgi:hypothetical protein